jgi:hypothetical protein
LPAPASEMKSGETLKSEIMKRGCRYYPCRGDGLK